MQCLRTTRVFTAAVTQTWKGNGCTGRTRRGTRAGKNVFRHIKTIANRLTFSDDSNKHRGYGVKQTNLVQIQTNSYQTGTLNINVRVTNRPKQNNVNVTSVNSVNLSNLKCVTLETKPPNRPSLLSICMACKTLQYSIIWICVCDISICVCNIWICVCNISICVCNFVNMCVQHFDMCVQLFRYVCATFSICMERQINRNSNI